MLHPLSVDFAGFQLNNQLIWLNIEKKLTDEIQEFGFDTGRNILPLASAKFYRKAVRWTLSRQILGVRGKGLGC
jgi:hypothetical protein